jgi:chemotaxis protein histidine kinase CheA
LQPSTLFSKQAILERRNRSIQDYLLKQQEAHRIKLQDKRKQEQELLEKQWELDRERRREVEQKKEQEKVEAETELHSWKNKIESNDIDQSSNEIPEQKQQVEHVPKQTITKPSDIWQAFEVKEEQRELPPVRSTGVIKLKFTPRTMNTPAREEKDIDMLKKYEVWKMNNKDRKKDIEDNTWIKERGDKLYSRNNYVGAVNAYSTCLENINSNPTLFEKRVLSNRSACYLSLENFSECIKDCNLVLSSEGNPDLEQCNKELFVLWKKCLIRRGTARWRCGEIEKAISDYEFAVKFFATKDDDVLISDLESMKNEVTSGDNQVDQGK